jgi:hypothetical protein
MGNVAPTAIKEKIIEIQDKGYCVAQSTFCATRDRCLPSSVLAGAGRLS